MRRVQEKGLRLGKPVKRELCACFCVELGYVFMFSVDTIFWLELERALVTWF
jgi:hypothetical protein